MFKKLFSFLIVLSMTLVLFTGLQISVSAEGEADNKCGDNVTYTLTKNGGTVTVNGEEKDAYTLTISGTGAMYNYGNNSFPWYNSKETITSAVIEDGVTSIGDYAFWGCSNLPSIEIPSTVKYIGIQAFYRCKKLTSITIPESVTYISGNAFGQCSELKTIFYPDTCELHENAFNLTTATLIKYNVNGGKLTITDIILGEGKAPVVIDENKYTYDKTDTDLMKKIAHAHDYAEGACTKCGVADPNAGTTVTTPTETEPTVTDPTGSSSAETDTTVTIPTVTDPTVTAPTVTDPAGADIVSIPESELNKILTPEEKANGVTVITEISEDVPDSDKSKVSALLGQNETAGLFLDITLYKNDSGILTPVTEIKNNEIAITVRIPDSIYKSSRTYFAVRVHDGTAERLVSVYDSESRLLTFYTNKFSTYAIAWTESEISTGSPASPSRPTYPSYPSYPSRPTVTTAAAPETTTVVTVTTAEEIIADGDYTGEDVSAGAADNSDDGGITDMSMALIVLAIAAAIVCAVLIKKIVF